jgi:hypothetical protein
MDMTDKIKETEVLRKHIIGENGIRYTLGEDGLYYPDLRLPDEIGRYGRMRAEYLKENHRALYLELLLSGKLNEYLHQTDEECYRMIERLVEQMKVKQGLKEQLKSENQMQWVGIMNNIWHCAEEVVLKDIVYA